MIKKALIVALALLPLAGFAKCTEFPVDLYDAYATTVAQDDEALYAYISIRNRDNVPHTISEVSSMTNAPRSVLFQAYASNADDDNIMLGEAEEIVVPPRDGIYMFRPNHTRIVLSGYKDRPNPGETIDLTLTFADGCSETMTGIPVQDPAGE